MSISVKKFGNWIYGKGRNSYRVLFTVLEDGAIATVRILHVRHASQQTWGEDPENSDNV